MELGWEVVVGCLFVVVWPCVWGMSFGVIVM